MDQAQDQQVRFMRAADELSAAGERVSYRNVRRKAGGGSFRDVKVAVDAWKKRGRPLSAVSSAVSESFVQFAEQFWTEALKRVTQTVEAERNALAVAREEAEADVEAIQGVLEDVETEKQDIEQQLRQTQTERDNALKEVSSVRAQLVALEELTESKLQALLTRASARATKG